MAKKKIIALKKGTFVSKEGKTVVIDDKKIDDIIAATLNLEEEDFPITIGHPTGSAPAWGWIKKEDVKKEGDALALFAEEENINKTFLGWLKEKFYKKVSIALREDNSIHHLAFLGAQPPAVKGLPVTAFSEQELEELSEIEFSEYEMSKWWFKDLKFILRGIKNWIIKKESLETANQIIPEYGLERIDEPPLILQKDQYRLSNFSENIIKKNTNGDPMDNLSPEEVKALQDKITKLEADNNKLKTDYKTATTQLSEKEASIKRAEYISFCESDEAKLKIKPDQKEGIIRVMGIVDNAGLIEFSEGEGDKKVDYKINPLDVVKELIKNQPDVVELSEFATNGEGKNVKNNEVELGRKMAESVND